MAIFTSDKTKVSAGLSRGDKLAAYIGLDTTTGCKYLFMTKAQLRKLIKKLQELEGKMP